MSSNINRRSLIKWGALSVVGAPAVSLAGACLGPTPQQPEGPFYPERDQRDKDNDLVNLLGANEIAKGQQLFLSGQVTDENCQPIESAIVEIWQACHTGRYNHSLDPNSNAALDKNFQYWGVANTDENGLYEFLTVRPGQYPADSNWIRPSHIHFKIHRRGFFEVITQMYFADDDLNSLDLILKSLPKAEQKKVIVSFSMNEVISKDNLVGPGVIMPTGRFNIQLKKVR